MQPTNTLRPFRGVFAVADHFSRVSADYSNGAIGTMVGAPGRDVVGGATPNRSAAAARGSACGSGTDSFAAPVAKLLGRVRGSGGERLADALFLTGPTFGMSAGGTGGCS